MKLVLINYGSSGFARYQAINEITGRLFGFDECRCYGPGDLDPKFLRSNAGILSAARGAGYWLWKPFLVQKALASLDDGDLLFYCDAAAHFVNPIAPMVELIEKSSLDLLVLGEGFSDAQYTKRDAFVLMECDTPRFAETPQRFASYFLVRKSDRSEEFFESYLRYAQDDRILTDKPNEMGLADYPGFVAHRHDQSIFSLLTKKRKLEVIPTAFIAAGLADRRDQIINHTRTHETPARIAHHLLVQGVLKAADLCRFEIGSTP